MKELIDTTITLIDTASNTPIHIHETIKLVESNNSGLTIWIPISIGILSLVFTICFSLYQLNKERKEKEKDRKEDRLKNKPILTPYFNFEFDSRIVLELKNNGLGSGININLFFNFKNKPKLKLFQWLSYSELSKCFDWEKSYKMYDDLFNINPLSKQLILDIQLYKGNWSDVLDILNNTELVIKYQNVFNENQEPISIKLDYISRTDKEFNDETNEKMKDNYDLD